MLIANFPSASVRHVFYRVAMGIKIAPGARLLSGIWFNAKGNCYIGRNTIINEFCRLDSRGGLHIGENVSISPEVQLITADHDIDHPQCIGRSRSIKIENNVFIGSRATILPGVTIKEGAVVAACACVTRDVEPYTVVAGVPAYEIRKRSRNLNYVTSYIRHFY